MSYAVLDASVFVAAVSPSEIHHVAARHLYDAYAADRAFLVPSLFRVEVLAALARRGEPDEVLDTVDLLVSGPRFHGVPVDSPLIERSAQVARVARLRAYDAVYVALALNTGAALLTLDSDVRATVAEVFPSLSFAVPEQ
ncbi:MAG: type II toxin-antitoxin system VapC family toxin [Deltaproteobacteria bacterium]|nr:type II toxin-antitoxin system VapC family toxin [Deltaproteobacteria bacterium]